jgi:Flp pilus assembly protein TadG
MKNSTRSFHAIFQAFCRSEAGGALVETAITLPMLVTLTLGAVEFARVAYASIEVANAAKAAVSYGAQTIGTESDTTGIQTVAANDASDLTGLTTTTSTSFICSDNSASTGANTDCSGSQIETILTVNTSASYSPIISIPGFRGPYTLRGRAVQKVLKGN